MAAIAVTWSPLSRLPDAMLHSPTAMSMVLRPLCPPASLTVLARKLVPRAAGRGGAQVGRREAMASGAMIGLAATAAVVGVVAMGAMAAGNRQAALQATRRGMQLFTQGDVAGSLQEFDRALELDASQRPYLWQRGLSLYYANRFEEGAEQFRDDVAVNPNDTEEAIWCFLCEAQLSSAQQARTRFLQVGKDPRPVMGAAYELFQTGGSPDKEIKVMNLTLNEKGQLINAATTDPGGHDGFYGKLYLGLFYEAEGDDVRAREYVEAAVKTPYGSRSGDYMAKLAAVHCKCRGWTGDVS